MAEFLVAMRQYERNKAPTTEDAYKITKYFGTLLDLGMLDSKSAKDIMAQINNASGGAGLEVAEAPQGVFDVLQPLIQRLFNAFQAMSSGKQ